MSLRSETKKYYREMHPLPAVPPPAFVLFLKRSWAPLLALFACIGLCLSSVLFMYDSDDGSWLFLSGTLGALGASLEFIHLSGIRSVLLRFLLQHLVTDI